MRERTRCESSERLRSVMSSMTLTTSRARPRLSWTARAFVTRQRCSPVERLTMRIVTAPGSSPRSTRVVGNWSGDIGEPSSWK